MIISKIGVNNLKLLNNFASNCIFKLHIQKTELPAKFDQLRVKMLSSEGAPCKICPEIFHQITPTIE